MIPRAYITEWTQYAPWKLNEQVEQDLVISRVLTEIFSDEFLSNELEELMGTKLRALYQRKKGRDLYDQYQALKKVNDIDIQKVIRCYRSYMHHSDGNLPTQELYKKNMEEKMNDPEFIGDTIALIRPEENWEAKEAYELIKTEILEKL